MVFKNIYLKWDDGDFSEPSCKTATNFIDYEIIQKYLAKIK